MHLGPLPLILPLKMHVGNISGRPGSFQHELPTLLALRFAIKLYFPSSYHVPVAWFYSAWASEPDLSSVTVFGDPDGTKVLRGRLTQGTATLG